MNSAGTARVSDIAFDWACDNGEASRAGPARLIALFAPLNYKPETTEMGFLRQTASKADDSCRLHRAYPGRRSHAAVIVLKIYFGGLSTWKVSRFRMTGRAVDTRLLTNIDEPAS
jgi:hypothetical protein